VRLLLDTHAFVWWAIDSPKLSGAARAAIGKADVVLVSAVAAWEIATKHRLGKWPEAASLISALPQTVRRLRFDELSLTLEHGSFAGSLPGPHRDPFDRMLMAQAVLEHATLVTVDPVFATYGIATIWE